MAGRNKLWEQLLVRKGQEGLNQENSWWKETDKKKETRGTVGGKKRIGRKNQGKSWWKQKDRKE
jgi:hypothetical protein